MIPGFATFFNSCFSWWQNLKQIILPQRREGTRTITTLCLRPLVAKSKTGDPPQETKTRKQKILVPWCLRGKTQNKRARHKETKAQNKKSKPVTKKQRHKTSKPAIEEPKVRKQKILVP